MKHTIFMLMLLLMAFYLFGQRYDGPFGLKMGLTLSQLKQIDSEVSETDNEGVFRMNIVPKPHKSFESYFIVVSPKTGLAKIIAISEDVITNSSGSALRSKYTEVRDAIYKKYGDYTEHDFVNSGSIWTEPQYFMHALDSGDAYLSSTWENSEGSIIPEEIADIYLSVDSLDTRTGYMKLMYEFTNFSDYADEIKEKEDSSF
ncbi:MAG: hypothetical protein M0P99_03400 [Candidatus Cloacimonetes bacterium]|nr:hypothetical protein [Candidatus Cloacimonadota bacterium]